MLDILASLIINAYIRKAKRLNAQSSARMVAARGLEEKRLSLIKQAQSDKECAERADATATKLITILK